MSRQGVARDTRKKMVIKICPVTGGAPTRMTAKSFRAMCKMYRAGKVSKPTGMGKHHLPTDKELERSICADCNRGKRIEQGLTFHGPKEFERIRVKEFQTFASPQPHSVRKATPPPFHVLTQRGGEY